MKCNERDDKWFIECPSEMVECESMVIVNTVCVEHEKCTYVKMLVYKMQERLGESSWSICMKQTL